MNRPTHRRNPGSHPPPPKVPFLLVRLLPASYRDDLVADLHEEYLHRHLPDLGPREAIRRFRRDLRRCVLANLRWRFSNAWRPHRGPAPESSHSRFDGGVMESVAQDLRVAARSLFRSPTVSLIAVLTLGLGIGANTAIFSVLDGVMLKPLPFEDPGRLVIPWETFPPREIRTGLVSYPNLEEWEIRSRAFEGLAGIHPQAYTLTGLGLPERVEGARVTADFFAVLGLRASQGRLLLPEDDEEGAPDVAVVTEGFWTRHFGDAPFTGGETITLTDRTHTVVGVLPATFDFPIAVAGAEVWTPAAQDFLSFGHREWPRLIPLARLREGVAVADAQRDMDRVAREMEEAFPDTNRDHGANVVSLLREASSRVSHQLMVLLGAVALVLFVACMNVANLLLTRGMDRRRELGVRSALGAGRWRVVRHLLTEGLLLSAAGGLLGMGFAWLGTDALVGLLPPSFIRVGEIGVDGRTLSFAALVSVLTCLLAAVLPALYTTRKDILGTLGEGSRGAFTRQHQRVRRVLIVSEVALAVMVLVGAGLLVRSFQRMSAVDPGFDPEDLLTFRVATEWTRMQVYDRAAFYSEAVREIAALPGVSTAGASSALPLEHGFGTTFQHEGDPELPQSERPQTLYVSVTPTFFETLGIPILRGRNFSEQDQRGTPGVVLVNQAAARAFWPDHEPLGELIRPDVDITDVDPVVFEVVGIVGDVQDLGLDREPSPTMYVPHTQNTWPTMAMAVRSELDAGSLVPQIREIINQLSHEASFSFHEMDTVLAQSTGERRFLTVVMAAFGLLALTLATVGVFGVLSYSVAQRRQEMGLRRALGADGTSIHTLVARESVAMLLLGGAIGIGSSLLANRLLASFLFGVGSTDAITYLATVGLVILSGLLASYLPARRATLTDPMVVMKVE